MATRSALVGRQAERAAARRRPGAGAARERLARAPRGRGGRGEDAARRGAGGGLGRPGPRGAAPATEPRRPTARSSRRSARTSARRPDGLADCGPLRPHLALILPELGDPAPASDRATVFEAVRCAFALVAREEYVLVVLDDLQWSDDATLELLPALAEPLGELPLLVVAAYRSDGLPRDHMLRRLRHELRRGGRLEELTLGAARADRDRRAARRDPRATRRRPRSCVRSTTAPRASPSSSRSSHAPC